MSFNVHTITVTVILLVTTAILEQSSNFNEGLNMAAYSYYTKEQRGLINLSETSGKHVTYYDYYYKSCYDF